MTGLSFFQLNMMPMMILSLIDGEKIKYSKEAADSEVFYFRVYMRMRHGEEFTKTRTYKSKKYSYSFAGNEESYSPPTVLTLKN